MPSFTPASSATVLRCYQAPNCARQEPEMYHSETTAWAQSRPQRFQQMAPKNSNKYQQNNCIKKPINTGTPARTRTSRTWSEFTATALTRSVFLQSQQANGVKAFIPNTRSPTHLCEREFLRKLYVMLRKSYTHTKIWKSKYKKWKTMLENKQAQ